MVSILFLLFFIDGYYFIKIIFFSILFSFFFTCSFIKLFYSNYLSLAGRICATGERSFMNGLVVNDNTVNAVCRNPNDFCLYENYEIQLLNQSGSYFYQIRQL